ncbi:MAG: hypothetical protein HWN66_18400, partial [Candidatus Helarchaeota archaeon]|nr:hypothetical protein [Candidatus Helarchaeota archaeon]
SDLWHDITSFSTNQWLHNRLQFDCSTDTFRIWLAGEYKGNYTFFTDVTDVDTITMDTGNIPSGGHSVYFDAIDYSWAPGYYPNRNMDSTPSPLIYAVFENGTQQTAWQPWSGQVQVDYNVSGQNLGVGVHNVSLVFNDRAGQWYHDDVIVFVNTTRVVDWSILGDLDIEISVGRDRDCTVTFEFQNTGNTALIDLNFSIFYLPASWNVDTYNQTYSWLDPGDNITISFQITVGPSDKEFLEVVVISFNATVMETGEPVNDLISVLIAGMKHKNITIWIILIIGSITAAATTSFVIIRKRQAPSTEPNLKIKSKALASLKHAITSDFPGTYSIISIELMERINSIKGITDTERELLIQDVLQMDENAAKKWIEGVERSLAN